MAKAHQNPSCSRVCAPAAPVWHHDDVRRACRMILQGGGEFAGQAQGKPAFAVTPVRVVTMGTIGLG